MTVADHKVVSFHYTLSSADGEQLESSREREPMHYLHGAGNIIPGLEKAMEGRAEGDRFEVDVPPEEAYGEWSEGRIQRISAKHVKHVKKLQPGQVLTLNTEQGPVHVRVLKVGRFNIDVDANHPLAGQQLHFDIEITGVRDATPEEVDHGHVHGPGGAHHHDHDHDEDDGEAPATR